jgi:plastocyanin
VQGEVKLAADATVPRPTPVENTTDPAVCGRAQTLGDYVVSSRNRGIQHVIVTVEGVPSDRMAAAVAPDRLVLDNRRCSFLPHASVLTVGSTIESLNSDPILHTVHFYGPKEANVALPIKDMRVSTRVDASGMIVVKCDVHGWMQAYVKVDTHPFHAVSDASGTFRIPAVPPGDYVLHAWHEKLGDRRENIRIRAGETTRLTITFAGR